MRSTVVVVAMIVSLALAACTAGDDDKATKTTEASAPEPDFVRTCGTSVYGRLGTAGWRKDSIVAGPVVFWIAAEYAHMRKTELGPIRGTKRRYYGLKLLVLVRPGAAATLVVPESERGAVALLYDPDGWNARNRYRIADGQTAVTFEACGNEDPHSTFRAPGELNAMTQFNGAFLVTDARCAPLDVFVRGEARPIRVTLSFGAGRCEAA